MQSFPGRHFKVQVRSRERHGRVYGRIELENIDLEHLIGRTVHVLVLSDDELKQLQRAPSSERHTGSTDICVELSSFEVKLSEILESYVNSARNKRELSARNRSVEELLQLLNRIKQLLGCR